MKYLKYFESIRDEYTKSGVDKYYSEHGVDYENPHFQYIKEIIQEIIDDDIVDLSKCLDMSCGNGEVSNVLYDNNITNIEATDPYLCDNFNKNFDFGCMGYSFEDISNGKLDDKDYTTVFCSYALHLCDKSILTNVLWNISMISEYLVIISPNNKPEVKIGWELIKNIRIGKSKCSIYKTKFNK